MIAMIAQGDRIGIYVDTLGYEEAMRIFGTSDPNPKLSGEWTVELELSIPGPSGDLKAWRLKAGDDAALLTEDALEQMLKLGAAVRK